MTMDIDHVPGFVHASMRTEVLVGAERVWSHMRDPARNDVSMSHDGYLKLYALSNPDLSRQFDIILFDEAQDANPVTADMVRRQRGRCVVVLVGDPHQAIYGFRGAVDALSNPEGATVLPLTGCFRFGTDIALLNSVLLGFFKQETRTLQGLRTDGGLFTETREDLPMTHIGRTNASVFRRAFKALGRHRIHFVGGTESYAFSKLLDIYRLSVRQRPHDSFYRSFDSVDELNEYARAVKDKETCGLLKLISQYGDETPHLVERVKAEAAPTRDVATMIVTTTHKAKGLEFHQVRVESSDFEDLVTSQGELRAMITPELVEEVNLHYVAMTRATHALVPSNEFVAAMGPIIEAWKRAGSGTWPPAALPHASYQSCRASTQAKG